MSDVLFESLVSMANNGISCNVTVFTNGQMISGVLISNIEFLETVANKTIGDGNNVNNNEFSKLFSEPARLVKEDGLKLADDGYYYLKNVSTSTNGSLISINGVCMKLKIDSVVGWYLGTPQ